VIRWAFIVTVALAALVLGFCGYMQEFPAPKLATDSFSITLVLNNLWRTLALFFFETSVTLGQSSPDVDLEANLYLVYARLLAPLATVGAIVELILLFLRDKLVLLRARRQKGHTIIVGCGEHGGQFLRSCRNARTVVIDCSNDESIRQRGRTAGDVFIIGDARNAALLKKAGFARAAQLVILGGDDAQNLEVLTAARSIHRKDNDAVNVIVRVDNSLLVRQLDRDNDFARQPGFEVTTFNYAAVAARSFFQSHPLVDHAELRAQGQVHLVCVGWTPFILEVIEQLARLSPYRNFPPPHVDMLVPNKEAVRFELDSVQPAIPDVLSINFYDLDRSSSIPTNEQIRQVEPGPKATVTAIVVSLGDDAKTASTALSIRERTQQRSRWRAPIFAHLEARGSLTSLLEPRSELTDPGLTIIGVGLRDHVCRLESLRGEREKLAIRIHESYLTFNGISESKPVSQRADSEMPWEFLKQTYRLACRRAADHFPVKILSFGAMQYGIPFIASGKLGFASSNNTLESLAELEHKSWEIDRRLDGWRHGTRRDDLARIHPALIPYQQLSEHLKDFDRDQIRAIASSLHREDDAPTVKREFRLGIFGHNKVTRDDKTLMLRELSRSVMPGLVQTHQHDYVSVCTPLAPGSDTILTEAILEHLDKAGVEHRLIIIRTLPLEIVIDEFESKFSRHVEWRLAEHIPPSGEWSEMKTLMAAHLSAVPISVPASYIADLIPPGLGIDDYASSKDLRILAYRRAASWLVERCDTLIAFHDPNRTAGPGGGRETLQWTKGETSVPLDASTLNLGETAGNPRVFAIEP